MLIFSCPRCDCPAFTLPAEVTAQSEATCARCRTSLGSWHDLKGRIEQYLAELDRPIPAAPDTPRDWALTSLGGG